MGLGKIVRWSNIEEGKSTVLAWDQEPRNEQWDDYNKELDTLVDLVNKDEPTESDESQFYKSLRKARTLRAQNYEEAQNPSRWWGGVWVLYAIIGAALWLLLTTGPKGRKGRRLRR